MIVRFKTKKFVVLVLSFTMIGSLVKPAQAFGLLVHDPINLVENAATAIATALSAAQAGIPGSGAVATTPAATCLPLIAAVDTFDTAKGTTNLLTSLTFGLIGESEFDAVKIEAELKTVTAAKVCVAAYLKGSIGAPSVTQAVADDMIRTQLTFQHLDSVYGERIEMLTARQSATIKQILRAVMLKILQNVEKDLTTRVVNGLVQKFKISNYLQYADALGGQVYAMDYINKNYEGDARQQMMVRQLVQSQQFGGTDGIMVARAFAQDKAEEFVGYDFKNVDITSPDFYQKLADAGNPNANPEYHTAIAREQSAVALSSGIGSASLEVANGKGFLAPRDCSGSISEQKAIDQRQIDLAKKLEFSELVLKKLTQSKAAASEILKAQTEYDAARQAYSSLPNEVSKPVIQICKSIENPGGAVADQINSFLSKHLSEATDFKPENLPFFATFLSDVASNFITNIVTGGKSTGQLFKETGFGILDSAVGSSINTSTPQLPPSVSGDGTTTPPASNGAATCQQVSEPVDQGIKLSCKTLPTARAQPFDINVDYSSLFANFVPEKVTVRVIPEKAQNGPSESTSLVGNTTGTFVYRVDAGITEKSDIEFRIEGKTKTDPVVQFIRISRVRVTLPTGQVQGQSIQKLSLRSYGPESLFTPRKAGITLR